MNLSKINVRYAKALFELGKEKNQLRTLHEDIVSISGLCRESKEFMNLLENPVLSVSQKKEVFLKIFQFSISDQALQFILLITDNHREFEIPGICRNFIEMVRKDQGILPATVTTARKLSENTLFQIKKKSGERDG